ncbi:MAG: 2-C-methyl-D-erythritol 4-phosphate cytidylyltransferase [Clostridia bacterium]|nr:2-C-methyl-D-erythritol 4-phosphate cytidylyltransferase [Clostridia bacterium]
MPLFNSPFLYKTQYKTAALILAAGNSTRMGGNISKQFMEVDGVPVLALTLMAYQNTARITEIVVAARVEDFDEIAKIREKYGISKLRQVVAGGKDRRESAERAFSKISDDIRYVAIADGARCLITPEEITDVCLTAYRHRAASAAQKVVGTVKRTTPRGAVIETVDRRNLWEAQTPQVFHVALYTAAMKNLKESGYSAVTDDNEIVERMGAKVQLVECSKQNMKITTPEDIAIATAILKMRKQNKENRS